MGHIVKHASVPYILKTSLSRARKSNADLCGWSHRCTQDTGRQSSDWVFLQASKWSHPTQEDS